MSAVTRHGRFVPLGITAQDGQVRSAADILTDDTRFAYLGEEDVQRAFIHTSLPKQESVLSIHLYKALD